MGCLLLIGMFLSSCTETKKSGDTFTSTISYTQIVDNYGYLRIDSILTCNNVALDDEQKIKEGKFIKKTSTVNYSTTFFLVKLPEARKSYTNLTPNDSVFKEINTSKKIYTEYIKYKIEWWSNYDYKYDYYAEMRGEEKIANPYSKVFDGFICYRPNLQKAVIIKNGEEKICKTLINSNGNFQDIGEHTYDYYFYRGNEYLIVLAKKTLACLDTIPEVHVDDICDDNTRYLILHRNDNSGFLLYDTEKVRTVVDKRSNEKSNILLEKEKVDTYTGFTNEDEFEGTNLLKVTFKNHERQVTSLLNETTMTHCSEVLYEDIKDFNKNYLIGFLQPQNIHNVVFTDVNGNIVGTIGNATGNMHGVSFGGYSHGNFEYKGDVNLKVSSSQTSKEKDNYKIGILISKKTGKETGTIYQIFDDGQKVRLR